MKPLQIRRTINETWLVMKYKSVPGPGIRSYKWSARRYQISEFSELDHSLPWYSQRYTDCWPLVFPAHKWSIFAGNAADCCPGLQPWYDVSGSVVLFLWKVRSSAGAPSQHSSHHHHRTSQQANIVSPLIAGNWVFVLWGSAENCVPVKQS